MADDGPSDEGEVVDALMIQQLKINDAEESIKPPKRDGVKESNKSPNGNEIKEPNKPVESNKRNEEKISNSLKLKSVNRPLPMGHDIPDDVLFKRAPKDDCDICFLELPNESFEQWRSYQPCCGKTMCIGCMSSVLKSGSIACPFCRSSMGGNEDFIAKLQKRASLGDSSGMHNLGIEYYKGRCCKRDTGKAMELFHQAAQRGSVPSHALLGTIYTKGENGVERCEEKSNYHELHAAIGGHLICRNNIAFTDIQNGYTDRAMKHLLIAASDGYKPALQSVKKCYTLNLVSKEDFANALRAHQATLDAFSSREREDGVDELNFLLDLTGKR